MAFDEWYCCLAVALDAEEDEAYDRNYTAWISAGQDPKKFPKRPKRLTATREKGKVDVLGALKEAGVKIGERKGSLEEYARLRRMQRVFQHADGTFRDADGNVIEPPPGSVYVSVKKH